MAHPPCSRPAFPSRRARCTTFPAPLLVWRVTTVRPSTFLVHKVAVWTLPLARVVVSFLFYSGLPGSSLTLSGHRHPSSRSLDINYLILPSFFSFLRLCWTGIVETFYLYLRCLSVPLHPAREPSAVYSTFRGAGGSVKRPVDYVLRVYVASPRFGLATFTLLKHGRPEPITRAPMP